jgi:hypothetical protein
VSTAADDPAQVVGAFTSIAIGVDGLPIISHFDQAVEGLRVTHCGNVTCTAGNVSTTVDDLPVGAVGLFTSIAIGVDGLPVIIHRDEGAQALRVTHCGNIQCTSGNVSATVDDTGNEIGYQPSVAIAPDGLAVISHRDSTITGLRVVKCRTLSCQ